MTENNRDLFKHRLNLKPYEYPEIEEFKEAIIKYDIMSTPTMLLWDTGDDMELSRVVGFTLGEQREKVEEMFSLAECYVILMGRQEVQIMLKFIGALVVIGWLLSFAFSVGGSLIHALLVVAAVIFIIDFIQGRGGL